MKDLDILKRLYRDYTKKYLKLILLAFFFSIIVAASTSAVAWLLDPAIKKIFINKDETLIYLIPGAIIFAFSAKGISLYIARSTMIKVAESAKKNSRHPLPIGKFNTHAEAVNYLLRYVEKGDCLLIKGSRGAKMENVIQEYLKTQTAK